MRFQAVLLRSALLWLGTKTAGSIKLLFSHLLHLPRNEMVISPAGKTPTCARVNAGVREGNSAVHSRQINESSPDARNLDIL